MKRTFFLSEVRFYRFMDETIEDWIKNKYKSKEALLNEKVFQLVQIINQEANLVEKRNGGKNDKRK